MADRTQRVYLAVGAGGCLAVPGAVALHHAFPAELALLVVPPFAVLIGILVLAGLGRIRHDHCTAYAGIASVAAGLIYLSDCNDLISIIGDNVVYIRDAMRLYAGQPMLDTQYGIGLKLMFVPAVALFPGSALAIKIVVAATGALLPLATYLVMRDAWGRDRALMVGVLSGVAWFVVEQARTETADIPFAVFSLLGIWLCQEYARRPATCWRWLIWASACVGWGYLVKSPAMFVAMGFALHSGLRGKLRHGLMLLAGTGCFVAPNTIYLLLEHPDQVGYFSSMVSQIRDGQYIPDAEVGSPWANLLYYVTVKNPLGYLDNLSNLPFPFGWEEVTEILGVPVRAVGGLTLLLLLVGLAAGRLRLLPRPMEVIRSAEVHDWYALAYLATLFVLPGSPIRYLVPILPWVIGYALGGAQALCRPLRRAALDRGVVVLLALGFISSSALGVGGHIAFHHRGVYPPPWDRYHQAAVWAGANVPAGSRIATRKPELVWYWTGGLESVHYPRITDVDAAFRELQQSDFLLMGAGPLFAYDRTKYLLPVLKAHPESFQLLYSTEDRMYHVFRIVRRGEPGSADSLLQAAVEDLKAGRDREARAILEELRARLPEQKDVSLFLALALLRQGELDRAEAECLHLRRIDPLESRAHLMLGQIHLARGRRDAGVEALAEAVRLNPGSELYQKLLKQAQAGEPLNP